MVAGSGREASTPASAEGTYKLSADRVEALKMSGVWDDPKQRAEAVKRYRAGNRDICNKWQTDYYHRKNVNARYRSDHAVG